MLSRRDLMTMIVETVAVCDITILNEDRCLPIEVCLPSDRTLVRQLAQLVQGLLDSYSHEESPEFGASCIGKSEAYIAVARKFSRDPMRRKANLARIEAALASLMESDDAYRLIANARHRELDEMRDIALSLSNPQQGEKRAS
jgi:hypothetical protein